VTFERRALTDGYEVNWEKSQTAFTNLHATSNGKIETEGAGMLQVLVTTTVNSHLLCDPDISLIIGVIYGGYEGYRYPHFLD